MEKHGSPTKRMVMIRYLIIFKFLYHIYTILFSVSVRLSHQSADLSFGLSSLNVCSSFVLSCITDHNCRSLRAIQIDSP